MANKETFENSISKLEKIVENLEASDLPLEKSLKLFEDGIKQARNCEKKLGEAEGKIQKLIKDNDLIKKENFEA